MQTYLNRASLKRSRSLLSLQSGRMGFFFFFLFFLCFNAMTFRTRQREVRSLFPEWSLIQNSSPLWHYKISHYAAEIFQSLFIVEHCNTSHSRWLRLWLRDGRGGTSQTREFGEPVGVCGHLPQKTPWRSSRNRTIKGVMRKIWRGVSMSLV